MTNITSFTVFVCYVFFYITCMVFCYKFRTFAEFWYFFLQNAEVDLYTDILELALFC